MTTHSNFAAFFMDLSGHTPHDWQATLAGEVRPTNRLIRVPTGMGKTAGTVLPWLWHRGINHDPAWPRRLVYCLPMRVLVEQTEAEIRGWLDKAGLLWDGKPSTHVGRVGVHVLMGGSDAGEWHLYPEENCVLIGTQDMLLSRALNRGYAAPRARWPMEFALLNQDALWVADEVQLMDVGLATTAQLQSFREEDQGKAMRPCLSWWMSATLQPEWLTSVDTQAMMAPLRAQAVSIPPHLRVGPLWESVAKPVSLHTAADAAAIALLALAQHAKLTDRGHGRITLVVLNRVERASEVYEALIKQGRTGKNARLIHSRFRNVERKAWREEFLARAHCRTGADLIIVATQVVEAGVDISAGCLITDLAPWPSLVQRFGRAARYGGHAEVIVLDQTLLDEKNALPYEPADIMAARQALARLTDVAQKTLEDFEVALAPAERQTLYPYDPRNLLLRKELDELFDTTPDLTGADLDISRFIRTGQERDCQVFWADWEGELPSEKLQPAQASICAVPVYLAHKWLFSGGKIKDEFVKQLFVWDYLADSWRQPKPQEVYPGRLVLVRAALGGYSVETGFTGEKSKKATPTITVVVSTGSPTDDCTALGEDNESLSEAAQYQTIAGHGAAVAAQCVAIATNTGLSADLVALLSMAGRYHDLGKVHPSFRGRINPAPESGLQATPDLAKAPPAAWSGPRTPGLRHELASALALLEMLARVDQQHPALLGGCRALIDAQVLQVEPAPAAPIPASLGAELRALTPAQFNLLVYLVCAHHGKVRAALHACPADQATAAADEAGLPIRGIKEGDELPPVRLMDVQGAEQTVVELDLHLAPAMLGLSGRYGPSWRERTLALQAHHGPFALAWLETMLRAADIRASREENA
jgi:CRISPR-associated endonuclease/helicase Cas3